MKRTHWLLLVCAIFLASLGAPARAGAASPPVPIVLIHGLSGSPDGTFKEAVTWLAAKGYQKETNLFAIDLRTSGGEYQDLGLLKDAGYALQEVRKILTRTGASQVDLVGFSRGGLIVRLLAEGETASIVRRAVSIDAPHAGLLDSAAINAVLAYAKIDPSMVTGLEAPADLRSGSDAIRTINSREARYADRRAPAMAVATTFQDGHDKVLEGHDGLVSVTSQLAWTGARQVTVKLGPTPAELTAEIKSGLGLMLARQSPYYLSVDSPEVWTAIYDFLTGDASAPARACEPGCKDWLAAPSPWAEATVKRMLPDLLPYELDTQGQRVFEPRRSVTRAEFVYGLVRSFGLPERPQQTAFTDIRGHWSLGYVEAAASANLVSGIRSDSFAPDKLLTRAEAATMVSRVKQYDMSGEPSRFVDVRGRHWAEKYIEAAAAHGVIVGDEGKFRPDDSLTQEEAAIILSRAFPKP